MIKFHSEYASRGAWSLALRKVFPDGCMRCGWNEGSCDVHHIIPRAEGGKMTLENGIVLCPNCHRLVTSGKITREELQHLMIHHLYHSVVFPGKIIVKMEEHKDFPTLEPVPEDMCPGCGGPLFQNENGRGHRKRRTCKSACRMAIIRLKERQKEHEYQSL